MLDKTLKFLRLIRDFEKIERTIYRPTDKKENDIEHSYQVAMLAWFLRDQFGLSLSQEKLLKYALVHDLVETYAGDTPVFVKHETYSIETKKEREEKALIKIKKDFCNFKDLTDNIESYEKREDEESIFIYELDKLIPALNIYMDNGYGWKKLGLNLEKIIEEKRNKIKTINQLVSLLDEALKRFEQEKDKLFNN
jgi:putative hydrolase of HD superfamily